MIRIFMVLCSWKKKLVEVNADISFNKGMENFTIAHEIGHIELHAPLLNDKDTSCIQC